MYRFIIEEEEEKDIDLVLKLVPKSPLQISSLKGKYNHTNIIPSKYQILGLLENCLGLYLPHTLRENIVKKYKLEVSDSKNRKDLFIPIISHLVDIVKITTPNDYKIFVDAYSCLNQRMKVGGVPDKSHVNGANNVDISIYHIDKTKLYPATGESSTVTMCRLISKSSMFYTSLYKREWLFTKKPYILVLKTTQTFKNKIVEALEKNKTYYLGNSESLINIEIL